MYHSANTARIARFGSGASILRGREALTDDQIAQAAPSVFAADKHGSRSDRYTYIPTAEVLAGLRREGFHPYEVRQGGSRDDEKRGFTKHLVRLRSDRAPMVGDSHRELVLLNSHDGTSSYRLMSGLFRMVCSNGLVVADGQMSEIRVAHKGDIVGNVIEGAFTIINDGQRLDRQVADMRSIDLRPAEAEALAEAALIARYGDEPAPIEPRQVLAPRRSDDQGADLWRTFNRVQENLTRGGIGYVQRDENGRRKARRETRPVNGIDGNTSLNRALWTLAARLAEIRA